MLNSLLKRPLVAALFKNSAWILADKGLRIVVGMFITAKMARMLGTENFGILHYALSISSIFAIFGSLGLESPLNRDISRHPEKTLPLMSSAMGLKLLGSLVGYLAALAFVWSLVDPAFQIPVLISMGLLFFTFMDVSEVYYHSQLLSSRVVLVRSSLFIVCTALRLLLLYTEAGVNFFLLINVLEVGVGSLILFFMSELRFQWKLRPSFGSRPAKVLLSQSLPLLFFGAGAAYLARADSIFMEKALGTSAIGLYSVAVRLTEIFYILPVALVGSSLPALSQSWIQSPETFKKRSGELFYGLSLVSWTLAIFVILIAPWIVQILFGEQYEKSSQVLRIYICALPFVFVGSVRNLIWVAQGHTLNIALSALLGCALATLAYWGIGKADLEIYALVFVVTNVATNWLFTLFFDSKLFLTETRTLFLIPAKVASKFAGAPGRTGPN